MAAMEQLMEQLSDLINNRRIAISDYDHRGAQILFEAARQNSVELYFKVRNLNGFNVNALDNPDSTALVIAASYGSLDMVKELLNVPGIDVNFRDFAMRTALMKAAHNCGVKIIIQLRHEPNINVNMQEQNGRTALLIAVSTNFLSAVKELLKFHDINVNIQDNKGISALIEAVCLLSEDVIKVLISFPGINVNIRTHTGYSALSSLFTCEYLVPEIEDRITRLAAVGATIPNFEKNMEDNVIEGMKVAFIKGQAIYGRILQGLIYGDINALRKIDDEGFTLNIRDNEGNGALNIVFGSLLIEQEGHMKEVFEYLFDYAPGFVCIENNKAENMFHIAAVRYGGGEMFQWLLAKAYARERESLLGALKKWKENENSY